MKKTIVLFIIMTVGGSFLSAQQIINTNKKNTCVYDTETSSLQSCNEQTVAAVFTFDENRFTFTHNVGGVNAVYAIENKVYTAPFWTYRINNGEGVMFDLKVNMQTKEYYFYPVNLTDGIAVEWFKQ